MKRTAIALVLFLLCAAVAALAQHVDVSASYLRQQTSVLAGNAVGLDGGRGEVALCVHDGLEFVGEVAGTGTGSLAGSPLGLTMLSYSGGTRVRFSLRNSGEGRRPVSAFGQWLVGGVHASNGAFPSGNSLRSTANAFALSAGGGLDVRLNPRVAIRVLQLDYQQTGLPNLTTNLQNHFRVGAGLVLRLR